jgi:hypothetical protein
MSLDRDSHAINQSYQEGASCPELEVLATALEKVHSIEEGLDELIKRVAELEGKVLACWCAPQPCHGDVLSRLAEGS